MNLPEGRRTARSLLVTAAYLALAAGVKWPLPAQLRTHLLGDPHGDLGVYIWNIWIFRHELFLHAKLPFSTDHIFAYTGGADFSMHNYAPLAGLAGVPLIGTFGVVGAFNLLLIVFTALSGVCMFVLARSLGLGSVAAWAAGALFMTTPAVVAREGAHFSLVLAFALPLFLWALLRTLERRRRTDAVLTGVSVAAAFYSDAYYGIFCALMGTALVCYRFT